MPRVHLTLLSVAALMLLADAGLAAQSADKGDKKERDSKTAVETEARTTSDSVNSRLSDLASQIVASLNQRNKSKIAVVEFSDLSGNVSELGQFLAEELITRLFRTGSFEVVERQLLNKIIEEHALNLSGLVDEASAKELGRLLGVDAIASGSITDLGSVLKINARLISSETGAIFAVAAVELPKDENVARLMQQRVKSPAPVSSPAARERTTSTRIASADTFFYEDFSEVEEGLFPTDWIGGTTLGVKRSDRIRGNVLTAIRDGEHAFTVPNVPFPDSWKIDVLMTYTYGYRAFLYVNFGNLNVELARDDIQVAGSWVKYDIANLAKEPFLLTAEFVNPVMKLYLNGQKILVTRCENAERPSTITVKGLGVGQLGIYRITGTALP